MTWYPICYLKRLCDSVMSLIDLDAHVLKNTMIDEILQVQDIAAEEQGDGH